MDYICEWGRQGWVGSREVFSTGGVQFWEPGIPCVIERLDTTVCGCISNTDRIVSSSRKGE